MMLQVGDDGVVSSVDEEELVYVDKNELEQFVESYQELEKENEQLKQQLNDNLQFLIRASKRLGFESLDHLLYTLDKGEITGYSTANWEKGDME